MKTKKQKLRIRILYSLKEKAPLSTNRGEFVASQFTKPNKKVRRHSGRYTPQIPQKGKFSEMVANAEEPKEEYDDWDNYRDGYRNEKHDGKAKEIKNEKTKRKIKI